MKEWYKNLSNRKILHIVLVIIHIATFFMIGSSGESDDSGNGILALLWLASGILEVIFIILEIKIRKELKNSETKKDIHNEEVKNEQKINSEIKVQNETVKIISEKNYNAFTYYNDIWFALKYKYKENLCFIQNLDKFKLEDTNVTFHLEEDNEYDKETIAVYVGDYKIGLLYKGNCRDIILKCIKNSKYEVSGFVYKKDDANNTVGVMIAFYEKLELRESFVTNIIKTSKKDMYDNKRQDNVDCLSEGDDVYFSEDYECEGLLVSDKYSNELGEINSSATDKINEDTDDLNKIIGIVEELSYTDSMKVKAKIRIYLTSYK